MNTDQAAEIRESAVHQKRRWVRLTRACNNRCMFCLDSGAQSGRLVPGSEVRRRILEGRGDGADRLILSGGEPTIHPEFLDFVAYGVQVGYAWIQTVSNGRMFGYGGFARKAADAGLREVTFSIHGHTPELHDRLAGVDGAFVQAVAGLRRAQELGLVVSVDVVLNRLNLPHLREILEFFMGLGVAEFDLLHLIPFGRGFDEFKDELFPDDDMLLHELDRALEAADVPGVFVWTNRLPIQYLEGREHLFQDPHKLYDEVLGEREAFKALFRDGVEPECRGPRCPHCFLRTFCGEARAYAGRRWDPEGRRGRGVPGEVDATPGVCRGILDGTVEVPRRLRVPTRETLADAREVTPDLDELGRAAAVVGSPVLGLPPCLGGEQDAIGELSEPDPAIVMDDGRLDLEGFVGFFIRERYMVKSLRCRTCALDRECRGLHVNLARIWGLGVLEPLNAPDEGGGRTRTNTD